MSARERVVFHPDAVAEARAAFSWYESRDESAARAFLGELDQALMRAVESPRTWPLYLGRTRRCLFERFPFSLVYREVDDQIQVIAVAHAKRRPGYWKER